MKKIWLFAIFLAPFFAIHLAHAEEIVYQKHTVIEFGDDTIEGDLTKPDGQYLESRKKFRHQRLIKVRRSFRTELLQTIKKL